MKCIIRISGQVGLRKIIVETLNRLRLQRKYACIVINPSKDQLGMIKKVENFVAFGEINKETFEKLIEKRGQLIDKKKKINAKECAEKIEKGKKYQELNLKPFFRLHPPRKGIDTKKHFPKGVLGNHKNKINELVERML
ncbi:MAG: uL30 family ribosomal protein [Nanoarchaeota archaeon]|nr:uL30 family ribosomal protein [Nanoarchaeota archaeon]MBU4116757.1 uL30 family ribosomal protein [Nanoarchaeota archaeon]